MVAVVSGASRGLGSACVDVLLSYGARVGALDVDAAKLSDWADTENVFVTVADVRSAADCDRAVAEVIEAFGSPVTGVVNNAGILRKGDALEATQDDWDDHMAVNARGAWYLSRAALPGMVEAGGGSIVNVISIEGTKVQKRHFAYTASKGALLQMTRSIAHDFADRGVRCNAVSPGAFDTEMFRSHVTAVAPDDAEHFVAQTAALASMNRLGQPEELGQLVAFLLSERASFMTGSDLIIDGGRTLRP